MKAKLLFLFIFISIFIFSESYAQRYWNVAARTGGATGGYVAVVPVSFLQSLSGSFTVECWFNSDVSGAGTLFGNNGIRLILDGASGGTKVRGRLQTNGNTKFYSRVNNLMDAGKWYHLCCTYDSTGAGSMRFYINGQLDTTRTGTGLGPDPGNDSLFIGKGNANYTGMIDDIRIWDRALSSAEITELYRNTYVGALQYNAQGIVMSCNFDFTYTGPGSGLYYYDGYNQYYTRSATAINVGLFPSTTILINNSLKLNGTGAYARMKQNADINFTQPITYELWIYPTNLTVVQQYLLKKGNDYWVYLTTGGKIIYGANSLMGSPNFNLTSNSWSHIAVTMSQSGIGTLYVNGNNIAVYNFGTLPTPATDTLFIGAHSGNSLTFNGYIDAVKISNFAKTQDEIKKDMYRIVDNQNKPTVPNTTVSLNFDCSYHSSNTQQGGSYELRNGAEISNPMTALDEPQSPLLGLNIQNFPDGYKIKTSDRRIPEFNTSGNMKEDSLTISNSIVIADVNFYVAIDHQRQADLSIKLFAPNGDSVEVWSQNYGLNSSWGNIITVFNDEADSSIVNGKYVDLSPRIKPLNSLNSVFSGDNAQGIWKIKIMDNVNGNTGYLNAFGLQFNNAAVFGITQNGNSVPEKYSLSQNYPNPFNPSTKIKFDIPSNVKGQMSNLKIIIYDVLGKEVTTLVNEQLKPGSYEVEWNAGNFASGIYYYVLKTNKYTDTKKMILIK